MMLPAAEAFSNPCLPPWWTEAYEAWAYLLVTLAVLLMHLVDYLIKVGWAGVGRAGRGGLGVGRGRAAAMPGGGGRSTAVMTQLDPPPERLLLLPSH